MGLGNLRSFRDVADIVADLDAVLGEQLARGFEVLGAARQNCDLGAGPGKAPRDGEPDTLAAAGDGGNAPVHGDVHFFLPGYGVFLRPFSAVTPSGPGG